MKNIINTTLILIGVFMTSHIKAEDLKIENFDDYWGKLGEPVAVENKFREILPQAKNLKDPSICLQIMSQIALSQALQKKFDEAHVTLDEAENFFTVKDNIAQVRIFLERGRAFHQEGMLLKKHESMEKAKIFFQKAFDLGVKNKIGDRYTIDAAHMIAIIVENNDEKMKWNKLAIELSEKSSDERARPWVGSLYNNLGQNYFAAKQFENALEAFQKALAFRKKEGVAPNIRAGKWAVASALRELGKLDEALMMLLDLIKESESISKSGNLDMPGAMFSALQGLVYGEVAEIYAAKTKLFAKLAVEGLSQDEMIKITSQSKIERLRKIQTVIE